MATGQKTEFEINAKDKTKRGLLSAQKNLKKTGKEADKLAGRFRNVARATVIMEGPLGGTAGRLSAMATMLNSVGLGTIAFGVGLTGMTAIVGKSLKRFAEWETQTMKINHLLKQTGGASGLAAHEIEEMAVRIGESTLESVSGVREASALLLSFKSVSVDSFESALKAATDLSAIAPDQGLIQSVKQLGKALEDPATGLTAMRRSGVSFLDTEKELIVDMHKMGNVAGAQARIFKLLGGQMGGTGEAAGGGLTGAADLLAERWGIMMEALAKTGAGKNVTRMFNSFSWLLERVTDSFDDINAKGLIEVNKDILSNQRELNALKEDNSWWDKGRINLLEKEYVTLLDKRELIHDTLFADKEAVRLARIRGEIEQKSIQAGKVKQAAAEKQKKIDAEADKQLKKDKVGAGAFTQKLIDEEQKFQTSLLTKSQQEDVFYVEKLMKLQAFHEAGALSEEAANAAGLASRQLHEAKLTEIHRTEKEKQADNEKKLNDLQTEQLSKSFGDLSVLMSTHSKRAFKAGKAATLAKALIDGYAAAVASFKNAGGYPWGIPAAAASLISTGVKVQKIKQQKMAAREFGGPVIGGRSYLVGERGPELFTAPRTGQIINNNATSNVGGQSNVFNITNVLENDEAFIQRNTVKIWDSIIDRMNEEGLRFA